MGALSALRWISAASIAGLASTYLLLAACAWHVTKGDRYARPMNALGVRECDVGVFVVDFRESVFRPNPGPIANPDGTTSISNTCGFYSALLVPRDVPYGPLKYEGATGEFGCDVPTGLHVVVATIEDQRWEVERFAQIYRDQLGREVIDSESAEFLDVPELVVPVQTSGATLVRPDLPGQPTLGAQVQRVLDVLGRKLCK